MILKGLCQWALIQTALPLLPSVGEMWDHGIKAYQMCLQLTNRERKTKKYIRHTLSWCV